MALEWIWKWGGGAYDDHIEFAMITYGILFAEPLHIFGSIISTISRFGERFCDGQYSLVSFLFAVLLTVTTSQAICKSQVDHVFDGVGTVADFYLSVRMFIL